MESDLAENINSPHAMAPEATHDRVFDLVKEYLASPSNVLDLGAGQGAFSKRMLSLGHTVTALDGSSENWKLDGVDLRVANLDSEFAALHFGPNEKFDAIIAIEIIEHLENPFSFIRQCAKLLKSDGLLFLTTPNVEAVDSRLVFLYKGRLKGFSAWETVRPAHITPIFSWKMDLMIKEAGLRYIYNGFRGEAGDLGFTFKAKAGKLLTKVLAWILPGEKGGESRIVIAGFEEKNV